jgi:hypothetical protein
MADVNGDGRVDLVFVGQNLDNRSTRLNIRVKLSNADGTWTATSQVFDLGPEVHSYPAHLVDLDDDGRAELVLLSRTAIHIFRPGPDGSFRGELPLSLTPPAEASRFVPIIADIDGDAMHDIVFAGSDANHIVVYAMRLGGTGGSSTYSNAFQASGVQGPLVGDLRGGGQADLLFLGIQGGEALLHRSWVAQEDDLSAIRDAYFAGDTRRYHVLLDQVIDDTRHSTPRQCVAKLERVARVAPSGLDGLESVVLGYQDCAAASRDPRVAERRAMAHSRVQAAMQFRAAPTPGLLQHLGRYDGMIARSVRSDASRVLLSGLFRRPSTFSAGATLADLEGFLDVRFGLCGLEPMRNQFGEIATQEVLRMVECALGDGPAGTGLIEAACQAMNATRAATSSGMGSPVPALTPPPDPFTSAVQWMSASDVRIDVNGRDLARLASLLANFCSRSGGPFSTDDDALAASSPDSCVVGRREEVLAYGEIARLMNACYGDPAGGSTDGPFDGDGALGGTPYDRERDRILAEEKKHEAAIEAMRGVLGFLPEEAARPLDGALNWLSADHKYEAGQRLEDLTNRDGAIIEGDEIPVSGGPQGSALEQLKGEVSGPVAFITQKTERPLDSNDKSFRDEITYHNQDGSTETHTYVGSKDGTEITVTVEKRDKDGHVVSAPAPEGGRDFGPVGRPVDVGNPACRELARKGLVNGHREVGFWDDLFGRGITPSKRRNQYPTPDDVDPTVLSLMEPVRCMLAGADDSPSRRSCPPVLCEAGSSMISGCRCSSARPAALPIDVVSCAIRCVDGFHPRAVNGVCMCESDADSPSTYCGGGGPQPGPFTVNLPQGVDCTGEPRRAGIPVGVSLPQPTVEDFSTSRPGRNEVESLGPNVTRRPNIRLR